MVLLKMGPMGPRGLGPNPFSTVFPCPLGLFFGKNSVPKKTYLLKKPRIFEMVVILASVDLNLKLKICKIAIQSCVRIFTYPFVPKRRVSKNWYERMVLTFFFDLPMKSYDTST